MDFNSRRAEGAMLAWENKKQAELKEKAAREAAEKQANAPKQPQTKAPGA